MKVLIISIIALVLCLSFCHLGFRFSLRSATKPEKKVGTVEGTGDMGRAADTGNTAEDIMGDIGFTTGDSGITPHDKRKTDLTRASTEAAIESIVEAEEDAEGNGDTRNTIENTTGYTRVIRGSNEDTSGDNPNNIGYKEGTKEVTTRDTVDTSGDNPDKIGYTGGTKEATTRDNVGTSGDNPSSIAYTQGTKEVTTGVTIGDTEGTTFKKRGTELLRENLFFYGCDQCRFPNGLVLKSSIQKVRKEGAASEDESEYIEEEEIMEGQGYEEEGEDDKEVNEEDEKKDGMEADKERKQGTTMGAFEFYELVACADKDKNECNKIKKKLRHLKKVYGNSSP